MSEEILRERPTITIEGTRYTIRKPGLRDCFTVPRILAAIQIHAGHNVEDFYKPVAVLDEDKKPVLDSKGEPKVDHQINVVAMLFSMASGIPEAEDSLTEWLASMLIKPDGQELTVEEAQDPYVLPLTDLPLVVEKLAGINDFPVFFKRSVHASKAVKDLWQSNSGKSKDKPGGRTNSSSQSHTPGSGKHQRPKQQEPIEQSDKD